jgi:SAM-dependent methyltransferase
MDVAAPPPAVSPVVRALCAPWILYRRRILRPRLSRTVFEQIAGRRFVIWPGVLNPVIFRAGRYMAEFIARSPHLNLDARSARPTALDLGTGCGVLAVFAALRGYRVTASDIEPAAALCARANAILNHVEDNLQVVQGDLFAPLAGQAFDVIVFNLPFFRGTARTPFERAWRSPDIFERCADGLLQALKPAGSAFFVLSSHGDPSGMLTALDRAGLCVERLTWRHFGAETMAIYRARRPPPAVAASPTLELARAD